MRCSPPAASKTAIWERLGSTSMPTYTVIRASVPELIDPRSLGCRAEQATGPDLHGVSSVGVSSGGGARVAPRSLPRDH